MTLARPGISLFGVLWLVVGVAMAAAYDYFDNVENGKRIASACWRSCSGRCCCSASISTSIRNQ